MAPRIFSDSKNFFFILFISLFVPFFSFEAKAGFQWTPPANENTDGLQTTISPSLSSPSPSPVVIEGHVTPPVSSENFLPKSSSIPKNDTVQQGNFLVPPPSKNKEHEEGIVQGFANNVPLVVALRQILPPEYGFSVAQDVQLNTIVSWQGGRPWRQILEEMLREKGLEMREQGKMISIVRNSQQMQLPRVGVERKSSYSYEGEKKIQSGHESNQLTAPTSLVASHSNSLQLTTDNRTNTVLQNQPTDTWVANRGETLRRVLEGWCQRANIDLSWLAEYDYPIQASVSFTGSFEEAVRNLLLGFQEAKPQPVASLHNNPSAGQAVLVVQVRGNKYEE